MTAQATEATFQNPVIEANFPDPFILKVDDTYYAYSTNSNSRNVPVATSTDLISWDFGRDALPSLPGWVDLSSPNVWAPEVIRIEDQYLLYYTARDKTTDRQCIGLAISDAPEGPFRDHNDAPFICQAEEGGSIDASPFRDEDGTLYLYWKNDGNCCQMATYLYGQQLSADGTTLMGDSVRLIRNDQPWHGPVVEAPTMWRRGERYYLFYSGNVYAGEKYAIGYAVCETPLGPCEDAEENPILVSDMETQPLVVGPGHQTVIMDEAGETWLVYHVWQVTRGGALTSNRQVWLDRIIWEDDRP
ncbi:MAG: family 43 glycosylhydrolase, partial [Anaerolineae bacterium]|nr:family 43 glycosylhydrolase [Anaerolineae bacterium]